MEVHFCLLKSFDKKGLRSALKKAWINEILKNSTAIWNLKITGKIPIVLLSRPPTLHAERG